MVVAIIITGFIFWLTAATYAEATGDCNVW